jgi:hypothetical protein
MNKSQQHIIKLFSSAITVKKALEVFKRNPIHNKEGIDNSFLKEIANLIHTKILIPR